jgi:hypothetical protein
MKPEGNKYIPGRETQVTHGTFCQSLTRSGRYPDPSRPISDCIATQDRVFPYYVPNSSIKYSKSDSKDRSQEIL